MIQLYICMTDSTRKFCIEDFDYELPKQLIADLPTENRDSSRMLAVSRSDDTFADCQFADLNKWLRPGDLLILNNTKVFPARLFGVKESGGKVEILAERIEENGVVKAQLKSNRTPKAGSVIIVDEKIRIEVVARDQEFFLLQFDKSTAPMEIFERFGHIPLPPYIERPDQLLDKERYQTVYAKHMGAVAAPTAGLHFSNSMLADLRRDGVKVEEITLHVGAGTFKPVKVQQIDQHTMHAEYATVSAAICEKIRATKHAGSRVIAVGTTCVRALETAALGGELRAFSGETDIFIYPGFKFKVVDALITNFHLPRSTLLMLVSAFAGYDRTMRAYQYAIQQHYRFYSYGDAMLITD